MLKIRQFAIFKYFFVTFVMFFLTSKILFRNLQNELNNLTLPNIIIITKYSKICLRTYKKHLYNTLHYSLRTESKI